MKRAIIIFITIAISLTFFACNNSNNRIAETTQIQETESTTQLLYFSTDELINSFFEKYNSLTDAPINSSDIKTGNIKTKAIVHIDDFSMEVINSKQNTLSISISDNPNNESTKLYYTFKNCIKANNPNIADEDIENAWNNIHESGYITDNYDLNGITITYVPYKELSKGHSNLRIDLVFSL